jgi:hypothetical protein
MQTLTIPIAFLVLAGLLLWVIVGCRGRWWLKLMLILTAVVVSLQIWWSLDSYFGHPRSMTFKAMSGQTAYLFWAKIDEPSNIDPGAIYMWLRPSHDIAAGALALVTDEPKLYKFPYDREFHEATQNFITQIVQLRGAPIEIQFARQEERKKGGNKDDLEMGVGPARVYVLPPPQLPPKLSSINQ